MCTEKLEQVRDENPYARFSRNKSILIKASNVRNSMQNVKNGRHFNSVIYPNRDILNSLKINESRYSSQIQNTNIYILSVGLNLHFRTF